MPRGHVSTLCLILLNLALSTPRQACAQPEDRQGDWIVQGHESLQNRHIRLDGSLILEKDATLELTHCTIEILGTYSREHFVEWRGGTLITRDSTIGGAMIDNVPIHTVFHLYDGLWDATDTTAQYAYGVSFHEETTGILRGTRFMQGPRPDAVIASGKADITLINSQFPIALGVYTHKGGQATLDLPTNIPLTRDYSAANLTPGVAWTMRLQNTTVPNWFVFLRNIGMENPPCDITLGQSHNLIVSLLGYDLTGTITLSRQLDHPVTLGTLTLHKADQPVDIAMWALYFSGNKNDITVTGESHICELMQSGGTVNLTGTPGKNELSIGCTTLELSGTAVMNLQDVHLGRPLTWQDDSSLGEANIKDHSRLNGHSISARGVRFHTRDSGAVLIKDVDPKGKVESRIEGGPVELR